MPSVVRSSARWLAFASSADGLRASLTLTKINVVKESSRNAMTRPPRTEKQGMEGVSLRAGIKHLNRGNEMFAETIRNLSKLKISPAI